MTKKIFTRAKGKSDILIALPDKAGFVSIRNGEHYDEAVVACKAAQFTPESLIERAAGFGTLLTRHAALYTLDHVEAFKTGTKVRHVADDEGKVRFSAAG